MKYILAILLLTSAAFADISHSFLLPIQRDSTGAKTNGTTWAGARDFSSSSNVYSDSLAVWSWRKDSTSDRFQVARAYLFTDTINSASYIDSIDGIAAGNSVRFDSIELVMTAFHAVATGLGCTGQVYMFIHDSCYVTNNYGANAAYGATVFNDVLTSPTATKFLLCDSVAIDTNTFGMVTGGPTVVTFTVKDRAILDDIECHISAGSTANSIAFGLMSCFDYSNTAPDSQATYNTKVSFYALENAGADPYAKVYWTEVEPVVASGNSGWQGSWRNASNSGWRNLWR